MLRCASEREKWMNFFERLGELTKSLFNINLEIQHLQQQQASDRQSIRDLGAELRQLARELQAVSERVSRLEVMREADRAELRAEAARFKAEVERAALQMERQRRLMPPSSGQKEDA